MFEGLLGDVPLLDRLDDLRKRLVRCALAIAIGIVVGFAFIYRIVDFLLAPTRRALPAGTRLIYTEPGEAFGLYIWISLIVGIVLAMPYLMYQLWQFVAPLVPSSARKYKYTMPFVLLTTIGFLAGAAFNHWISFPYMMAFFASFNTSDLRFMPKLQDVFDLYSMMMLAMGAIFQMPAVVFFLAKAGLVTAGFLWRSFKYAFLIIFIVAAVITPTGDMMTQTIFATPMVALYLLSIGVAWVFGKARITDTPE